MHLVYRRSENLWHLTVYDHSLGQFASRQDALDAGHARGACLFNVERQVAQLIVHRMDGTIKTQYEYGLLPTRPRGGWTDLRVR